MQKIKEDADLMRQFPRRPRFGVRLPSILKIELRWLIRYHLWDLIVFTRIAKYVNNRTSNVLNDTSYPCSLIQDESRPLIVDAGPPFPATRWGTFRSSTPWPGWSRTRTNQTRILHYTNTDSATKLMKTFSYQSPSLSWMLMKQFVQKPPNTNRYWRIKS
jgi:hypothetical protein